MNPQNKTDILTKAFFFLVILEVLLLVGLLMKYGSLGSEGVEIIVTPTPEPIIENEIEEEIIEEMELDLGTRTPDTIEEIEFSADPSTNDAMIWLVRLRFENAEVLEVRSSMGMLLPSCPNNRNIDGERVCVDIANNTPFVKGDKAFIVKVKWEEGGKIYRSIEDGYYNGEDLSFSNVAPKVAGVETAATVITFPVTSLILFVIGSILVFSSGIGFYLLVNNDKKSKINSKQAGRVTEGIVTAGLVIMIIGTIFSIALFTNTVETVDEDGGTEEQLAPAETEYVYVYITPTTVNITLTPSPSVSISPTITSSPYPLFVIVYISITPTPTLSPTPTPITDNIYIECGAIDVNDDTKIDYIDLPHFTEAYNHICIDGPYLLGCGGKDTNTDNTINYIDLYYFLNNYYPKTLDCTIY